MSFRKYWLILLFLLCFARPIARAAAESVAEHKEARENLGASWLAKDLEQRLRGFFAHDFLVQKLLDKIFIRSQPAPPYTVMPKSFLLHKGKTITNITLHKHGRASSQGIWWQAMLHKITPTTKDWVIWEQLPFAVGDRLAPQQLLKGEKNLDKLPFIGHTKIEVKACADNNDVVDVHVTTQDRFPITVGLASVGLGASLGYNNLLGWGHSLQGQLLYQQGLGYGSTYRAPNIRSSGVTSEGQYLYTPKKTTCCLRAFRKFDGQADYAGGVTLGYKKQSKERLLDGHMHPKPSTWSLYHWDSWLGKALGSSKKAGQGQFFATGRVSQQYFKQRPLVARNHNRYFHRYVLGVGSLGFANKRQYEDQRIYGIGDQECIPYGSKINLTGGYQFGEWFNRPYLRLDLVQGWRKPSLGHWYGVVSVGTFWHAKAMEQSIVKLHLNHFTPLLRLGKQWLRQFINLSYLGGFNLFTGECISTNTNKVPSALKDPFPGGTQRFQLGLETVVFMPVRFAGCQVAALGFVEAVRLQDAQGKVRQQSFCKALGLGLRCEHARWRLGTLQVKVSYQPLVQGVGLELGNVTHPFSDLNVDAPGTIPFQEY